MNNKHREKLRKYGITHTQYMELELRQGGVCAICKQRETLVHNQSGEVRSLALDHCHETGMVRGFLCNSCNRKLGYVRDDPYWLEAAKNYLDQPPFQCVKDSNEEVHP